jgi:hypothetical protein
MFRSFTAAQSQCSSLPFASAEFQALGGEHSYEEVFPSKRTFISAFCTSAKCHERTWTSAQELTLPQLRPDCGLTQQFIDDLWEMSF